MTRDDYLALMRRALDSPYGVALQLENWVKAEQARRRIYTIRDAFRRKGDTTFNTLSLVQQPGGKLLLVRRDQLPRHTADDGLAMDSHTLGREELPKKFGYCNTSFRVSKPR